MYSHIYLERAQVETQYWGNLKVAWLEGNPAILLTARVREFLLRDCAVRSSNLVLWFRAEHTRCD